MLDKWRLARSCRSFQATFRYNESLADFLSIFFQRLMHVLFCEMQAFLTSVRKLLLVKTRIATSEQKENCLYYLQLQ